MTTYTPIKQVDEKLDVIEHINQDHIDELLLIANVHCQSGNVTQATIIDIFDEAVEVLVEIEGNVEQKQTLFIPFEIQGELEEKILYLAYSAIIRSGKDISGSGKCFFEIVSTQRVTTNFVRLTVRCESGLPEDYAGYAYSFALKVLSKVGNQTATPNQKKSWAKNLFDRLFLVTMKHLSSKNRNKVLSSFNKGVRLYTLRKSWKESEQDKLPTMGEIDVFTHGGSAGSEWVESLNVGDVIMSRSETGDKHQHLTEGQALLIADETAYPALAGIVESWQGEQAPHIVLLSQAESEQSYFDEVAVPDTNRIHRIVCASNEQGTKAIEYLQTLDSIDCVWAALETTSAKQIRHYCRNERQISGRLNQVKGYWKIK